MNIHIITLGCKVNKYESEAMLESSIKAGFLKTDIANEADVVVVNSCTVTEVSVKKAKKLCRRIKRENPDCILVLCGCMPQVYTQDLSIFNGIDIVMGTSNRNNLISNINKFMNNKSQIIDIVSHQKGEKFEKLDISNFDERTRAFVKIEDGCENYCSYCMIPFARGFVRSKPLEDIKKEVQSLSNAGYKEVVLTGINLCAYGKGTLNNLCDAVEEVAKVDGIKRIRLSSLEPDFLTDDVISRLSQVNKLCPSFHLSLQSGCDETLKRMNRHYNTNRYYHVVQKIRECFENCSFTTDVMVGFPEETEEEFNKSLDFVRKVKFLKVHVFPYSMRNGTVAAKNPHQIDSNIKKQRSEKMIDVSNQSHHDFLESQIGITAEVLFERLDDERFYEGFSCNYATAKAKSKDNLLHEIKRVKITDVVEEKLLCEIIE